MAHKPKKVAGSTLRARLARTHDERVEGHAALEQRKLDRQEAKRAAMAAGSDPVPPDKRAI